MRGAFNKVVIGNLKPSQWSEDLMAQTQADVVAGAMKGPWCLESVCLDNKLLSRRMPVREEREAGFKTRWSMIAQRAASILPHRHRSV